MEAESRPLKRGEEGAAAAAAPEAGAGGEKGGGGEPSKARRRRLSGWRTAAFFAALFLGLAVVFVFSFVIPCPVRPVSQRTWRRTFGQAAAYQRLAVGDVDRDGVQDVLFAARGSAAGEDGGGGGQSSSSSSSRSSSSANGSCAGLGPPACAFVVALSGANGSTLWQRPVAEDILFLGCFAGDPPSCFVVGKPDSVTAIDLHTGQIRWREAADFGANSTVLSPLLEIPDVNGDGAPDLLVLVAAEEEVKSFFYSGKYGTPIGASGRLHLPGWKGFLLQVTTSGSHYVLFYTARALYGYSLKELFHMAIGVPNHRDLALTVDPLWEVAIDSSTHHVPLLSSGEIHYLAKLPGKSGTNILVVRSAVVELLDGQSLGSIWASEVAHIQSEPVPGSFAADEVDVIVESRVAAHKKKIMILEGGSGSTDWEVELFSRPGSPRPATLPTADHKSIFLFWGAYQMDANGTGPEEPQQLNLYLFHPVFPNVLLEMSNSTEPILAFEAVLFEQSRHACYLLLTEPQADSVPRQVTISKRRLKEDIVGSRVIWLSQLAQDTEQDIRDRLSRMRYRSIQ